MKFIKLSLAFLFLFAGNLYADDTENARRDFAGMFTKYCEINGSENRYSVWNYNQPLCL